MKCEKCNGIGAYSYVPEMTEEERKNSTSFPSMLPRTPSKVTTVCEMCKGSGEINYRSFEEAINGEIEQMKKDIWDFGARIIPVWKNKQDINRDESLK